MVFKSGFHKGKRLGGTGCSKPFRKCKEMPLVPQVGARLRCERRWRRAHPADAYIYR